MEKITKGHFTLPAQANLEEEVKMLAKRWGVDTIRDSDGTTLSQDILSLGLTVYSTLCLIRSDQQWIKDHMDMCQQKYLISFPITAESSELKIKILKGYSHEQFKIDIKHSPKKYWEVNDRTSGKTVSARDWEFNEKSCELVIKKANKWHVYTVSFLVHQIWESTSMYNYITNKWTGEHQAGIDPRQPEAYKHIIEYYKKWLMEHLDSDYVRFTSIAYQFPLIKNEERKNVFLDWSGFHDCTSAFALDEFEKEYGYRLLPEHLVDAGYMNATYTVPKKEYLDWIDFTMKFIRGFSKELVDITHKNGKKAFLFFCDHWIGTEPYREGFEDMKFDGIVGPCLSAIELRRIAEVPGDSIKEVRLYPYFFEVNLQDEPVFKDNGDPVAECKKWWKKIRRGLLRRCVDRIGFGGYLELAVKYPKFIDYVEKLADEFREVLHNTKKSIPYSSFKGKLAILNAWGRSRTWIQQENWPYGCVAEILAGLPVELEFINFDDIRKGISMDIKVILNWGNAYTSWSGGDHWTDTKVVENIREFVANGGGFIGINEPTAFEYQGRFFQLFDVLGVQKETGLTLAWSKNIKPQINNKHFILEDIKNDFSFKFITPSIYFSKQSAELLSGTFDNVLLSANSFGKGRSVYFAGYNFDYDNIRMMLRAVYWAAGQESSMKKWFSSNEKTDCAYYPETKRIAVMNNDYDAEDTVIYNESGKQTKIELDSLEIKWFDLDEINNLCK
ncbi:MAG: 1,3-beta-galactosyl-N-acetylhexosamine phosphorylase [Spirochaetes bacterium]|nr:1,3-beta-galactosyl-N-acetylhexosamine phosphorylase [Spirochaetota bacterium]